MSQVYANAVCNIAVEAANTSTGLFGTRIPATVTPVRHALKPAPELGLPAGTYDLVNDLIHGDYLLKRTPLNKRAWVYQERMLSPRIIHIMDDVLLWECDMRIASEAYPFGVRIDSCEMTPPPTRNLELFKLQARTTYDTGTNRDSLEAECIADCRVCSNWGYMIDLFRSTNLLTRGTDHGLSLGLLVRSRTYLEIRISAVCGEAFSATSLGGVRTPNVPQDYQVYRLVIVCRVSPGYRQASNSCFHSLQTQDAGASSTMSLTPGQRSCTEVESRSGSPDG